MKKIYLTITAIILVGFLATAQTRIYAPALRAPANNATDQVPNVALDWDAVTGQGETITYTVQLAQQADFSDATTFGPTILTAVEMNELKFDEVYYWRVKAADGITTSDWSAPFSFRVVPTVTITSPNNQTTQNPDPLVKWNTLSGVTHYDLQIDTAYSWAAEASGVSAQLNDVFELDADNAWAVGNGGVILKKTVAGWESVSSPVTANLQDVFFVDANNGWAVGASGKIVYYNGTEWTEQSSGVTTQLNGIYFSSAANGYAVGATGTALHFDGTAWSAVSTGITVDIYAAHGLDANHIWVVGKSGNVAFFDGATWEKTVIVNRDMLGVWMLAPNKVFVSAKAGRVYFYDGSSWTEQTTGSTRDLNDVCFIDDNHGFAAGAQGTLAFFNGNIWTTIASGSTQNLFGVYFSGETSGYIVGNSGVVIAYQGDGFNSSYLKNFSLTADVAEFRFSNLAFGKNHYFRMRARHASSTSDWSSARSFTVVSSPELDKPANNATNIALDTLVQWDALTGVVRYTVQLATEPNFVDPFTFETGANTYRFSGLAYGQDYYWRVNTRHAGGVSNWSEVWKFTTSNTVTLVAPADNATEVARMPLFEWQPIRGTEKYLLEVSKANTFTEPSDYLVTTAFYQTQYFLDASETYFWRVRGIQGLDSTSWSATRSFVTTFENSLIDQNQQTFSIHPNPGNGQVSISLKENDQDANLEVYTLVGKKVYAGTLHFRNQRPVSLDLSLLGKGVYLVRLNTLQGNITRKLIIE